MRALADVFATGSQATSYVMGAAVLAAAGAAALWSLELGDIAGWAFDVLGAGFIALLTLLVLVFGALATSLLGGVPFPLRLAIVIAVEIVLMTYVLLPRITAALAGWIYPTRRQV